MAIDESESKFITHEDLITINEDEKSFTRRFFEDWMVRRIKLLYSFFGRQPIHPLSEVDRSTLHYISDKNIERFSFIAIFVAGAVMFVTPLWILQAIHNFQWRLGVITIFIFVFLTTLTLSTVGRPFEILAATAG